MLQMRWFFLVVLLCWSGATFACPICERATGRAVRERIFDGDFGFNGAPAIFPFALVFAVVGVVGGWFERSRG
jgi:hypothetical protein